MAQAAWPHLWRRVTGKASRPNTRLPHPLTVSPTHPLAAASPTWPQILSRRLTRHGLAAPVPAERLAEQVGVMCGAHAQIMSAAELSIGLRVAGATRTNVQSALWVDHSLIKTFGPRGTVHLLPAQDLPLWTGALASIPATRGPTAQNTFLTPAQTDEVVAAMAVALAEAELTIDQLNAALVARLGSWAGELVMPAFQGLWPRWRQAVDTAANRGLLCFGPNHGRNITYTNPRRWLPGFKPAPAPTALAFVVKRYLYAYGPATPQHFAGWLNAPPRWATGVFDSLKTELQPVEVDGNTAWLVAGDTTFPAAPPTGLRLLPYFDAYAVGSHPREKLFPGRAAERALAGGQAGNFPLLLINGTVAGVWGQNRSGRKLTLTVEPFSRLTAPLRRDLDEQVTRLGEILEGNPQLTIGQVTVGPHA